MLRLSLLRKQRESNREPTGWLQGALAGGLVFAVIGIGASIADRRLHPTDVALALALTPAVFIMTSSLGGQTDISGRLWPGLAGLGGLLLLLPAPNWSSWRYDLALVCMPVLMAGALHAAGKHSGTARTAVKQLWAGGLLLGALTLLQGTEGRVFSPHLVAALLDGATAWLTVAALARVGAERFSAQFFLVPLIAALEGIAFLRPALDVRSWLGMLLLALGGGALLVGAPRESAPLRLNQ